MSKEVKRYRLRGSFVTKDGTQLNGVAFVAEDDYDALLAERDALRDALKNLRAATPSLTCESFHHARRDQHDHDEECPPFERWIAAALACNVALQGEQK